MVEKEKGLTVGQLIEALQKFPPDWMVVQDGYEGGLREVYGPRPVQIVLNVNAEWYYGPHEPADSYEDEDGASTVEAVVI